MAEPPRLNGNGKLLPTAALVVAVLGVALAFWNPSRVAMAAKIDALSEASANHGARLTAFESGSVYVASKERLDLLQRELERRLDVIDRKVERLESIDRKVTFLEAQALQEESQPKGLGR